jgi:AbrB family looped-hinge helix DNA binding protein
MAHSSSKLTRKYQVTLPSRIRKHLHLREGGRIYWIVEEDRVLLQGLPTSWTDAYRGLGADMWKKAGGAKALRRERAAWDRSGK